jgi:hypothetical protein
MMMMQRQSFANLLLGGAVVFVLGLGVLAQSISLTVTAYSDAVRFSAQGAVKELRVEVLSLSGQKVFDSGPVLGNTLDWKLLNTQGQPVANGVYLYTVTVKDPSGNVTKKLGKLAVLRGKGIAAPPLSGITVGNLAQPRLQIQWDVTGNYTIQGNLGVGTETPLTPIHVRNASANALITLDGNDTGFGSGELRFLNNGTVVGRVLGTRTFNYVGFIGEGTTWFRVFTGGSERLRVTNTGVASFVTGKVGIGTISPAAQTHINNTANQPGLRIDSSDGTNALEIYNTGSGSATGLIFRVQRDNGNVYAKGSFSGGGADVAERIDVTEAVEPGDVVEIDPENPGKFRKAREALSTRVAGVISTAPGVVLGNKSAEHNDARPILALAGRVPVKVTAKYGAIAVGDLLVSSPIPGYAMKCPEKSQCIGAVIGKALEPLAEGVGVIEVQVMLR